jgi:dTDP-4-amino-4,6-dideoxygalactose transaminase/GNAT superfamily N-acetyltransferase
MIPLFKVFMAPDVLKPLGKVLYSGYITQGEQVEKFENQLRERLQHPYILTLNSGTSGLILALRMLDLPSGSEVLCTAMTCTATNWAVLANGLHIKWVDTEPNSPLMDLIDLESKITSRTRAIVVVHWGGESLDMTRLNRIRDMYGIPIVEDCAHAFGAMDGNGEKFVGLSGNISVYSFQAIKTLTAGDGGLIILPTQKLYDRAKLLRWFGISRECPKNAVDFRMEHDIEEWGYKFHMNDINATIGMANLPFVDAHLDASRRLCEFYNDRLSRLEGYVRVLSPGTWLYTLSVPDKSGFIAFMREKGITTSQVHQRNDIHSCVAQYKTNLPNLTKLEKTMVCIPMGWWVTPKESEYIVNCIAQYVSFRIRKLAPTDCVRQYTDLLYQLNGHRILISQQEFVDKFDDLSGDIYICTNYANQMIGAITVLVQNKLGDPVIHLEDIVVDERWRGFGFGRRMVIEITKLYGKVGHKIILSCKPELRSFYRSCGFVEEGITFVRRRC